ncbi:hypothetical protein [Streptomyces justiciae]|uniref:DUF448 domain-containing protein n=1 Tax=Streptomyces justiciae TaxID=2780140 RepID=A0ABU3LSU7_9ACTN|nr:hypothetical protein [Streptomyces justiciae]MDT7842310.1 hypothetical protein [Streptomyces justiciae]
MTINRHCPTCRSRQDFRKLNDDEKAWVRAEGSRSYVDNLWRCTAVGCLTYFRIGRINDRGLLPEKFKKEPPADAERP